MKPFFLYMLFGPLRSSPSESLSSFQGYFSLSLSKKKKIHFRRLEKFLVNTPKITILSTKKEELIYLDFFLLPEILYHMVLAVCRHWLAEGNG